METKRIDYLLNGQIRDQKKTKTCVICGLTFYGGGSAKYCLEHKIIGGEKGNRNL